VNHPLQLRAGPIYPPKGMREVCLFFCYYCRFARRRGWRTKREVSAFFPMDANAPFRAKSLALTCTEGDPADIQQFIARYELKIASPDPWFEKYPLPQYRPEPANELAVTSHHPIVPGIVIPAGQILEISFRGEPFTPLKHRLVWQLEIRGTKLYYTPEGA
jgi:hypothetical protein